jgi:hypothetical protein
VLLNRDEKRKREKNLKFIIYLPREEMIAMSPTTFMDETHALSVGIGRYNYSQWSVHEPQTANNNNIN